MQHELLLYTGSYRWEAIALNLVACIAKLVQLCISKYYVIVTTAIQSLA